MDESPRQRAMRLDVKISQQAMRAVMPTNQQIGPWQSRAAHLLALAQKLRATGRHDPSLTDEAQTLLKTIEMHRRNLDERVRELPSDVKTSTRLEDTARALASVATVLGKALSLMKAGKGEAQA